MKLTYFSLFLLLIGSNCNTDSTTIKMKDTDYIVTHYSSSCEAGKIDSNLVLTPTRCQILIDDFEKHPFHKEILKTSKEKWMLLITSDSPKISQSAALWLYFLHNQKIGQVEFTLLLNSSNSYQQIQIDFWEDFFERTE